MSEQFYARIGSEIGELVQTKQTAYGDSFGKSGGIMKILYPDGIPPEKMEDALTVVRVIDKLFRIATNKDALGESPWKDIAGYALLEVGKIEKSRASGAVEELMKTGLSRKGAEEAVRMAKAAAPKPATPSPVDMPSNGYDLAVRRHILDLIGGAGASGLVAVITEKVPPTPSDVKDTLKNEPKPCAFPDGLPPEMTGEGEETAEDDDELCINDCGGVVCCYPDSGCCDSCYEAEEDDDLDEEPGCAYADPATRFWVKSA